MRLAARCSTRTLVGARASFPLDKGVTMLRRSLYTRQRSVAGDFDRSGVSAAEGMSGDVVSRRD